MNYSNFKIVYYPLYAQHIEELKKHEFELDALKFDYDRVDVMCKFHEILAAIHNASGYSINSIETFSDEYTIFEHGLEKRITKFIDENLNWEGKQYRLHKFYRIDYMNIYSYYGHLREYHILLWLKKVMYGGNFEVIEFKDMDFIEHKEDSEWIKDRFIIIKKNSHNSKN